ncbi:MAG: translation initiation factor IF-1 [Vicinamibacteria bacterium]|nr:translation initiation factor IF-1 [Vicinamibacteria bacterium]
MPDAHGEARETQGVVVEALPNALYRVELADGNRPRIVAHIADSLGLLRVLPGDEVCVEIAGLDASRARIVRRCK